VPLLEHIYETGEVETEAGDRRPAVPLGVVRSDAVQLAELVRGHDLLNTLETGLAYGLSTLAIAGAHEARGRGSHIAIDPVEKDYYEGIGLANLRRAGLEDRVRFIPARADRALPELVQDGVRLDMAFIDGSHLFDYAFVDFFYTDRMLIEGGLLVFHDLWMPAVQNVVEFAVTNRAYQRLPEADGEMAVLRKHGPDRRPWNFHRSFATSPREERALTVDEDARRLFDRMRGDAERAGARAGGLREHKLVIAESAIRMRFAGPELEPALLPAFAHALGDSGNPSELEILLWDSESTGVSGPETPWLAGEVRPRGDVLGYEHAGIRTLCEPLSGAVAVFDPELQTMVYWVLESGIIPWYETGAPLRAALHEWATGSGRHFVHAGAVGCDGKGVLLTGLSGSGKSTTALACLEAGMDYAGDDYVILTPSERPRAHCLYSTAKLDAGSLERLPGLRAAISDFRRGEEEKTVLDLHRHRPAQLRASLPVDAIVLPSIGTGERPTLRRTSAADALRAVAPSTLLQLPRAGRSDMDAMVALVRGTPAWRLELGSDMTAVPDLIAEVCQEVGPPGGWTSPSGG
jgi:predicted O-methyltransferase YrrM